MFYKMGKKERGKLERGGAKKFILNRFSLMFLQDI